MLGLPREESPRQEEVVPVQEELPPKPAEPQPAPQPEVTRRSAIAMYDYEAANPGDMSFKAGEVMELSEVSTCRSPGGFIATLTGRVYTYRSRTVWAVRARAGSTRFRLPLTTKV